MAYDEALAKRVRKLLGGRRGITEREQFGGIGFLIQGNMAVGVIGKDLLVRVGPDRNDEALRNKDVRPFDFTGRPSKGWILVRPSGLTTETKIKKWIEMGSTFARSLPAK